MAATDAGGRRGTPSSTLQGWGRLAVAGEERRSEDLARITRDVPLSRGLARSYGDASLPPPDRPLAAGSRLADRILAFDPATGVLHAEAGLSLGALSRLFLPRGFASPVMTGTQFVTLGGMVAADVHGKNHHREGTFGRWVRRLRLRTADGRLRWCDRGRRPELFRATLGGMGLTGHILEVELTLQRIPSPWVWRESERVRDLKALLAGLRDAADAWPFTVAWIDCLQRGRRLGRGILLRGRWASAEEAPPRPPPARPRLRVPVDLPAWALGRWPVRLFNLLYYHCHPPWVRRGVVHPEPFFHPLDTLLDWNRLYGRRGFTQYQCVLPAAAGPAAVRTFLETVVANRCASAVNVVKDCGAEGEGMLSFPFPGTSVALDLPVRDDTRAVVDRLNACVAALGGRIYLAKDAFTRAADFRAMEPRLDAWLAIRRQWDPEGVLRSAQSVRLMGDRS